MEFSKKLFLLLLGLFVFRLPFVSSKQEAKDDFEDEGDADVGTVIGIDLGTTYSVVGVYRNGKVEIIANEQGERITPSYVAFTEDETLIGDSAKNQVGINPTNTVFSVKRLIGSRFAERSVRKDIKMFPYTVRDVGGFPSIEVVHRNEKKTFKPKEISAMVLSKMKKIAENFLGETVTHAVITVPAYFNDAQRKATKEAGAIAGLVVMRIINEPTAAAIAYGLDKKAKKETNVLVYDLGGGTFDVSMLTVDGGVFEVRSTNGNTHLGGEDFDLNLVNHLVSEFRRKTGVDISKDKRAFAKLKKKCEKAKRELSGSVQTTVTIEKIVPGHDLKEKVTRAQFEKLNMRLFKDTLKPVSTVLADAKMKKSDVHEVVLVGGSTRIPAVQRLLQDFFEGKRLNKDINPDEAVAYGAAVQGFILSGRSDEETKSILLLDVTPMSLGIETVGGVHSKVINKNTPIPTSKTQTFTTNENDQTTVSISVSEGEARMVRFNHELGKFDLTGIAKAPRGVPQIEVSFDIDANGILLVTATDKSSGKNNKLKIDEGMSNSKSEELKKMKENFEKFQEEDEKIYNRTIAKNHLNAVLYQAEDYKKKEGDKISKEDADDLDKLISETRSWNDQAVLLETEAQEFKDKAKEVEEILKEIQTGEPAEEGEEEAEAEEEPKEKAEEKKSSEEDPKAKKFKKDL